MLSKDINCDALLIPIVGGFKIKLKNEDKFHSTYRTRFSCAHEMAHTFFYEIEDGGVPFRAVPGGSKYEEKLCDIAAAELLMPKDALEKKKLINWLIDMVIHSLHYSNLRRHSKLHSAALLFE